MILVILMLINSVMVLLVSLSALNITLLLNPKILPILDASGCPLARGRENPAFSLLGLDPRRFGVPSLKALCAYTIFKSGQQPSKEEAPELVRNYLNSFN